MPALFTKHLPILLRPALVVQQLVCLADGSLRFLGKGLVTEKFQPRLAKLVFAGFSVFLGLIYAVLSIVTQTQRRSYPAAGWQPQMSKDLGEPYLERQKVSHVLVPVQYPQLGLV